MPPAAKPQINNVDFDLLEGIGSIPTFKKQGRAKAAPKAEKVSSEPTGKRTSKAVSTGNDFLAKKLAEVESRKRSAIETVILQESFPFWTDENRGVPNPFIRSGLFSVKTSNTRAFMKEIALPSLNNYSIEYSGEELQQDDLSVWMALINLASKQPMSDALYFTGYRLLKDLKWTVNSRSYLRLQESIKRLKVTAIQVGTANKDQAYAGSLIREYSWNSEDEKGNATWMVRFEPRVSILFMHDSTTLLEWETRQLIGNRAAMAQWLHAYYSSHKDPFPISIQKIHELCRSEDKLAGFRRTLTNALQRLVFVDFLSKFWFKEDMLYVQKKTRPRLALATSN